MIYLIVLLAMLCLSGWLLQLVLRYVANAEGPFLWCVGMIFANGIASMLLGSLLAGLIGNELVVSIVSMPLNFLLFASIIKFVTGVEWKPAMLAALVATIVFVVMGVVLGLIAAAMGVGGGAGAGGGATP